MTRRQPPRRRPPGAGKRRSERNRDPRSRSPRSRSGGLPGPKSSRRLSVPGRPRGHSAEEPSGTGSTWIFGPARLTETLEAIPKQVRRVLVRTGRLERRHQTLLKAARARGVPVQRVPNRALDRIAAGVRHQGAAAEVSPVRWGSLGEILVPEDRPDLLLLLDGIQDPRNFGALVRTADGAGVGAVLVPGRRAAPPSAAAMAASAGTLVRVRLVRIPGSANGLRALGAAGYRRVGLAPRAARPWHAFDWRRPTVLAVGSEGRGLGSAAARECDALLSLPQLGSGRSLNVSVAAGIVLYEAVRQRSRAPAVQRTPGSGIVVDTESESAL